MSDPPAARPERGGGEPGQEPGHRPRFHADYAVAIAIALSCLAALYVTTTFEQAAAALARGMQPADFPQLVLYVMLALTGVIALQAIGKEDAGRRRQPPVVWYTIAAILGFVVVAEWVDVLLAISLFYLVVSWLWGERNPMRLMGFAISLPIAIYFVFGVALEVRFPRGLITNLIYG